MAAIDKTYLVWEDYLILKEWCKNTELIYDNGKKGSPMDFLFFYDEPYEGEVPVWNTSWAFDDWLYYNCPLPFIQDRLKEQYSELPPINEKEKNQISKVGTHYKIISHPKIKIRHKRNYFWIEHNDWNLIFGIDSRQWYSDYKLMPPEHRSSCYCCRTLSKRKLNRLIKKWKLPIGTILNIQTRFIDCGFRIKIV